LPARKANIAETVSGIPMKMLKIVGGRKTCMFFEGAVEVRKIIKTAFKRNLGYRYFPFDN